MQELGLRVDNTQAYVETFLEPIRKCKTYRPKFGQGKNSDGLTVGEFKDLYGNDPFYAWMGLDDDLMYAAHRAAGGMTSVYRQIGIGCERLFREILKDACQYKNAKSANWSYETKTNSGKTKTLSLDGRLELSAIRNSAVKVNVENWLETYCKNLGKVRRPKNGIVFEVRQGYKSKDSKRQNADIDNGTVAWANDYLPVFAIFSAQIDGDLVLRYRNNRCGILVGNRHESSQVSLYEFSKQVLEYDLAGFFQSQSRTIQSEIHAILQTLLSAK